VLVNEDQVCRRLMTVPGVGALVSLTCRAGVDDPGRFTKSKSVEAFFGLAPKRYQSGETDVTGGITRVGDASVRTALHDAANARRRRCCRARRPWSGWWPVFAPAPPAVSGAASPAT